MRKGFAKWESGFAIEVRQGTTVGSRIGRAWSVLQGAGPLLTKERHENFRELRVNLIWRFFMDQDRKWKWQRLSFSHVVVEESAKGYSDYDGCLADATSRGYTILPPLSTRPAASPRIRR